MVATRNPISVTGLIPKSRGGLTRKGLDQVLVLCMCISLMSRFVSDRRNMPAPFSLSAAISLARRCSPIICVNVSGRETNGVQLFAVVDRTAHHPNLSSSGKSRLPSLPSLLPVYSLLSYECYGSPNRVSRRVCSPRGTILLDCESRD